MALRYPLVLNGTQIQEVQIGDTVAIYPTALPITLRTGVILKIGLINGSYFTITKRDNTIINITAQT